MPHPPSIRSVPDRKRPSRCRRRRLASQSVTPNPLSASSRTSHTFPSNGRVDSHSTMRMICVNQNKDTSVTTSTPRCVADWAHTQEQVLYAIYLLLGLVILSLIWTIASRRQRKSLRKGEIGFSLKCRRWARTSRTAAIIVRNKYILASFACSLGKAFCVPDCSVCLSVCLTVSRSSRTDPFNWS